MDHCESCGVAFEDHKGLLPTCRELRKAKRKIERLQAKFNGDLQYCAQRDERIAELETSINSLGNFIVNTGELHHCRIIDLGPNETAVEAILRKAKEIKGEA